MSLSIFLASTCATVVIPSRRQFRKIAWIYFQLVLLLKQLLSKQLEPSQQKFYHLQLFFVKSSIFKWG